MILKSLRLRNIRSYTDQAIEFPRKSFVLSGDIGSGKSTILLAIEFALFGIMRGLNSGGALLRKGTTDGSVDLSFEIDKKPMKVGRGLKRQKNVVNQVSGYLEIDGERQELTPVEIKARVLDLLGYPKELLTKSKGLIYRYTVFTPQEEMKAILFEEKDARLDTLRKVFGIDKYQRIKDNAQIYVRSLKDKKKELEGYISDIKEKEEKKKANDDYVSKVQEDIKAHKPELDKLNSQVVSLTEEIQALEKNINRKKEIEGHIEVINSRVLGLVEERKRLTDEVEKLKSDLDKEKIDIDEEDVQKVRQAVKDLELRISRDENRYKEMQEKLSDLRTKADIVKNDLKKAQEQEKQIVIKEVDKGAAKKLEAKKKELAGLDNKIKASGERIAQLRSMIEQSNDIISKISELDECPTCEQDVPDLHKRKVIDREKRKIAELNQKISAEPRLDRKPLVEEIEALEKRHQEALSQEKENERARKELEDIRKKIEELKSFDSSGIVSLEKQLKQLDTTERRKELDELKKKESELNIELVKKRALDEKRRRLDSQSKLFESIKEKIAENNREKLKLQEEASSLHVEGYDEKKGSLDKLKMEQKKKEIAIAELNKEIETYSKIQKELEEELEKKYAKKREFDKTSAYIQWLEDYFVKMAERIERQVMMSVYRGFNELFKTWFNMLIEDELLNVRLDTEFTPIIEQNGYETDVTSLSGGEKTSCALAYRLALNKVINDIMGTVKTKDLIILDEPTDGFSSEQLDRLRDVIEALDISQIIIVSHENKIESFVEEVIRVSKTNHESIVG